MQSWIKIRVGRVVRPALTVATKYVDTLKTLSPDWMRLTYAQGPRIE